jgi:hypothetical protein
MVSVLVAVADVTKPSHQLATLFELRARAPTARNVIAQGKALGEVPYSGSAESAKCEVANEVKVFSASASFRAFSA